MSEHSSLFTKSDLRSDLESHERRMLEELTSMEPEDVLARSPDDLAAYFVEEFRVEVPVLLDDSISVQQRETRVDVRQERGRYIYDRSQPFYLTGTEVAFFVPFEGDGNLFACVPSTRTYNPPIGEVVRNELVLRYTRLDHDAEAVKASFDAELAKIRQYLEWMSIDVVPFNEALPTKVRTAIERRREKLLADRGLIASLGYKLRVREDAPRTYAVPAKRRNPPIRRPPPNTSAPFKPEPELLVEEYEQILDILSNMVLVMERSPEAFRRMKEEHVRDHFLVQLNGQYEGQATGETFNFEGKTDILVRADGKNVFIAECKFWHGPKTLTDTVDQLLGYASWRDTKIAILLFNRTKNLSAVLAKVPEVMEGHPNFKRAVSMDDETTFRYVLAHRDDPNRELIITVLVFEVPL